MEIIGQNLKYLRKRHGLTQEELAVKLGVNRAMIGSYEENRAIPKLPVMQVITQYFGVTIDELTNTKLWESNPESIIEKRTKGDNLRILNTVTDNTEKELITSVPIQASAGYTKGYADPEFVEELPCFSLPLNELSKERTYRVFQIKGDSMEPIKSGSYIITEYLANWNDIVDGETYVVITLNEGLVYKRLYNRIQNQNEIILKSDNPEYQPYSVSIEDVLEVWKALGFISFSLPRPNELDVNQLHQMILDMKNEINSLKKNKN